MTEMKLRRGKANPKKEAEDFTAAGKDKDGFDVKYINSDKGRGVFSCVQFIKGDFLMEYRGQLINKLECDRRQKLYHDALKVFMFEFNGKLLCVDAAREDGSLGRLVNDDHINPNSKMKTITVRGKPYLCLFATWSINPGEEITYNYGDSEWPWRNKTAAEKHKLQPQEMSEVVSEADPLTPTTAVTLEAVTGKEQNEAGTVAEVTTSPTMMADKPETEVSTEDPEKNEAGTVAEVTTSPTMIADKPETEVPTEDPEKNEAGTVAEVTTSPTMIADKSETEVPTEDPEKIAVVNEQSGSEGQETIGPNKKTAKNCKHEIIPATVSSMNKCAACVGPVVPLRWIGLRCKGLRKDLTPKKGKAGGSQCIS